MIRFKTGDLVMTSTVNADIAEDEKFSKFVSQCMRRYLSCDWGDLDAFDKKSNDDAVHNGDDRILASYNWKDKKLWVITEWNGSVTTLLWSDEY